MRTEIGRTQAGRIQARAWVELRGPLTVGRNIDEVAACRLVVSICRRELIALAVVSADRAGVGVETEDIAASLPSPGEKILAYWLAVSLDIARKRSIKSIGSRDPR